MRRDTVTQGNTIKDFMTKGSIIEGISAMDTITMVIILQNAIIEDTILEDIIMESIMTNGTISRNITSDVIISTLFRMIATISVGCSLSLVGRLDFQLAACHDRLKLKR
jgi:hypothetical protein